MWGSVGGNVTVIDGGKFYLRGTIYGSLFVAPGGRVHIFGQVLKDVILVERTKVIHSGVVGGDVINEGGRLLIERCSKVGGKVKARSGETKYEAAPPMEPPAGSYGT